MQTNGLTTLTQSKTKIGASMVKDTCLRTGFVLGYQTAGPGGSRNQHLLLTNNKHGPQKNNKKQYNKKYKNMI